MTVHPLQRVQLSTVARRYYVERQTKSRIADDLGISRFKVARLLDQAVEEGLIRFEIAEPADLDAALSEAVRARFGLRSALVLAGGALPASALVTPLGTLAAHLLEEILVAGQVLGVAWGRTLAATARALSRLPAVDVVQAAGSMAGLDYSLNSVELVHRLAGTSGGEAFPLYGPMWVEDAPLARQLRDEPSVARTLARQQAIDVLMVGIGSWDPPESCLHSTFPPAWRERAGQRGVVADLCATLIDARGAAVPNELDTAALAIGTELLRRIPNVVGVGGGTEKAGAIAAVLRGGWLDTLVTDAGTARRLLA